MQGKFMNQSNLQFLDIESYDYSDEKPLDSSMKRAKRNQPYSSVTRKHPSVTRINDSMPLSSDGFSRRSTMMSLTAEK